MTKIFVLLGAFAYEGHGIGQGRFQAQQVRKSALKEPMGGAGDISRHRFGLRPSLRLVCA